MTDNNVENKDVFLKTSDLYFSAFLLALDVRLIGNEKEMDKEKGREKTVFVFKVPTEHSRRLKTDYFSGAGTVSALKYAQSLRNLKSMCFVV